jgi:hypothetical protein
MKVSSGYNLAMCADGVGGALLAWVEYRSGTSNDIYGQHIYWNGEFEDPEPPNGLPVCAAPLDQNYPSITTDGSYGAIVAWLDSGSGAYDIYAQRIASIYPNAGVASRGTAPAILVAPNPARAGRVGLWLSLSGNGPARLDFFDVEGRRQESRALENEPGRHTVDLLMNRNFAPGLYWIRLTDGSRTQYARFVLSK